MVLAKFLPTCVVVSVSYLLTRYIIDGRGMGFENFFTNDLIIKSIVLGIVISGIIFLAWNSRVFQR